MADPLIASWRVGEPIYRVHDAVFAAAGFNDSGRGDARFSPIRALAGKVIPTLYGGATRSCALMETVFHDVPAPTSNYILDLDDLDGAVMSCLAPRRDLRLLALTAKGLKRLGLAKSAVIETPCTAYANTRALAQTWHRNLEDIDGLLWISRQDDEARACVLFGDRVRKSDFAVREDRIPIDHGPRLEDLLATAQAIGIRKAYAARRAVVSIADLAAAARGS